MVPFLFLDVIKKTSGVEARATPGSLSPSGRGWGRASLKLPFRCPGMSRLARRAARNTSIREPLPTSSSQRKLGSSALALDLMFPRQASPIAETSHQQRRAKALDPSLRWDDEQERRFASFALRPASAWMTSRKITQRGVAARGKVRASRPLLLPPERRHREEGTAQLSLAARAGNRQNKGPVLH